MVFLNAALMLVAMVDFSAANPVVLNQNSLAVSLFGFALGSFLPAADAQVNGAYPPSSLIPFRFGSTRNYVSTGLNGKKLTGSVMPAPLASTMEACRQSCSSNSQCIAFSRRNEQNNCELLSSVTGSQNDAMWNSEIVSDRPVKMFTGMEVRQVNNKPYFQQLGTFTLSATACQVECAKNSNCAVAMHTPGNNNCVLTTGRFNELVRSSSRNVYLFSNRANLDGGFTYEDGLFDRYGPMLPRDRLTKGFSNQDNNPRNAWALDFTADNDVIVYRYGVRARLLTSRAASLQVLNTGQLRINFLNGTVWNSPWNSACGTESGDGSWSLSFFDDELRTVNKAWTKFCWRSNMTPATFPTWFWPHLTDIVADNHDKSNWTPLGQNSRIFVLDSGMSRTWIINEGGSFEWTNLTPVNNNNIVSDPEDRTGHGTLVAQMAKNFFFGLGANLQLTSIKITEGTNNSFSERSAVRGMQTVFHTAAGTSTNNIVNFSGYIPGGSARLDCAIQWLYHQGTAVVVAAGNSNDQIGSNPFRFVIGAYAATGSNGKSAISADSGYGSNVDLFAPESYINLELRGSSIATGMASVVLAFVYSKWSSKINKKPNRAFKWLVQFARVDKIDPEHWKAKASRNRHKSLTIRTLQSEAPQDHEIEYRTTSELNRDFCGQFSLPPSNPSGTHWATLINGASTTRMGETVTRTGSSIRSCQIGCST